MFSNSRKELESRIVKALSRYIGYTTGAYKFDRIYSILRIFKDKPSVYEKEIIDFLASNSNNNTEKYTAEIINFATSMQIIEVVTDRNVRVRRYAPTQLGRATMGINLVSDKNFYQFFRTKITLLADADALVPLLIAAEDKTSVRNLHLYYLSFQNDLRDRRLSWLRDAFSNQLLYERITEHLPWVNLANPPNFSTKKLAERTAQHHVTPRRNWLIELGLMDRKSGMLTQLGSDVKSTLAPNGEYFWLGPPTCTQSGLRILPALQFIGPTEDNLSFSSTINGKPSNSDVGALIEKTTNVMIEAYKGAKLVYAPQVSLQIPIEYINYRSYIEKIEYDWRSVLDDLFRSHHSSLVRLSARKGLVGFYKVIN